MTMFAILLFLQLFFYSLVLQYFLFSYLFISFHTFSHHFYNCIAFIIIYFILFQPTQVGVTDEQSEAYKSGKDTFIKSYKVAFVRSCKATQGAWGISPNKQQVYGFVRHLPCLRSSCILLLRWAFALYLCRWTGNIKAI